MYNTTDVHSLGTDYTVLNREGKPIGNIQVITQDEILEAAVGPYDHETFDSFDEYLEQSISVLSGFEDIVPSNVLWYSTTKEDVVLSEVVELAIKKGCTIVILEHIEDVDL